MFITRCRLSAGRLDRVCSFVWRTFRIQVLRDGAEAADEVASETLGWAKEAMGLSALKDF